MRRNAVLAALACVLLRAAAGCDGEVITAGSTGGASSTGPASSTTTTSQGGASSTATTGSQGGASSTGGSGGSGGCGGGSTACDGVCVTLATDPDNCGACGAACSIPNATPACAGGVCGIAACDPGYADCDGEPANGCETDMATDSANCGACGYLCLFAEECQGGSCQEVCDEPGWTICGDTCTNLEGDPDNCGACGNVCTSPDWCSVGLCAHGCPKGWTNCDGNPASGCNVELGTIMNCAFCDDSCAAPSATAVCDVAQVPPTCELVACNPGYADCDGVEADGCEVDVMTDPSNCGACSHACASGQTCAGGACQ